mgnify:CR=1 FL=1
MSKPIDIQILEIARAKVANPKTWTRGCAARDRRGEEVAAESAEAVRWCALGAVGRAMFELGAPVSAAQSAFRRLDGNASLLSISAINDLSGRKAALALFDRALEEALT